MKVLVVFYSTFGHGHIMAEAVAEGAKEVAGAEVELRRALETLPPEVLEKMGAVEAQNAFSNIPVCTVDEISGGSLYGAFTIAGGGGSRMPSENELEAARFQGMYVAVIASRSVK